MERKGRYRELYLKIYGKDNKKDGVKEKSWSNVLRYSTLKENGRHLKLCVSDKIGTLVG